MRFRDFTIVNFKGIKQCTINVDRPDPRVFSLIGLNESGKTTILEAINYFVASDITLRKIYNIEHSFENKANLVPKSKKANFNEKISISATLTLDKNDISALDAAFDKVGYVIDKDSLPEKIEVAQHFSYSNSNFIAENRTWSIALNAKKKREAKYKAVGANHECWKTYYETLHTRIPQICYFPTFLFELPDRIYLESFAGEKPVNSYYRRLFQDILDSLDNNLDIKTHIVDRIRTNKEDWSWFSFLQTDEREQVNHVLLQASTKTTKVIIDQWRRVFNRGFDNKRVEIDYGHDAKIDAIYVKIYLVDGSEKYEIGDRSLGFRWFFCFWLFTHFRTLRAHDSGVVFLLDEPASNLHARAQEELLNNISTLASDNNIVIYSTHSHYLVNPKWLDTAYIVANGALTYNGIEEEFLSSGDTNITTTRYSKFVGKHPNQRTYFLPVLDALDYKPSEITLERPALLVEGKTDYAFLELMSAKFDREYSIVPGNGAKSLNPLISIFTGWGFPFVILLDDDKEGIEARKMYKKNWNIPDEHMKTIYDFSELCKGISLESFLLKDLSSLISSKFEITSVKKDHVQLYISQALHSTPPYNLPGDSKKLAANILEWSSAALSIIKEK